MTPVTELELRDQALSWPDKARAALVTDAATYTAAGELLLGIKALRKQIDQTFDPIIADAHKAHRTACEKKRAVEAPLSEAESILKRALVAFDQAEERRRREEQRRVEAEARQRAEAEALERAAAMEKEGREYGDQGLVRDAEQLVEETLQAPPPPVAPIAKQTPKVQGIAIQTVWDCEVVDLPAFITYVAQHPAFANLLMPNLSALRAQARSLKSGLKLPGVKVFSTQRVAAGGR